MAPSSFGAWINYAGTHHFGAVSFFIVDFFLFFGVAVLTVVQASQVSVEASSDSTEYLSLTVSIHLFGSCCYRTTHLQA